MSDDAFSISCVALHRTDTPFDSCDLIALIEFLRGASPGKRTSGARARTALLFFSGGGETRFEREMSARVASNFYCANSFERGRKPRWIFAFYFFFHFPPLIKNFFFMPNLPSARFEALFYFIFAQVTRVSLRLQYRCV